MMILGWWMVAYSLATLRMITSTALRVLMNIARKAEMSCSLSWLGCFSLVT